MQSHDLQSARGAVHQEAAANWNVDPGHLLQETKQTHDYTSTNNHQYYYI